MAQSKKFKWNKSDTLSALKGMLIAMTGAGLTYILGLVEASDLDPLMVSFLSSGVNVLRLYVKGK